MIMALCSSKGHLGAMSLQQVVLEGCHKLFPIGICYLSKKEIIRSWQQNSHLVHIFQNRKNSLTLWLHDGSCFDTFADGTCHMWNENATLKVAAHAKGKKRLVKAQPQT